MSIGDCKECGRRDVLRQRLCYRCGGGWNPFPGTGEPKAPACKWCADGVPRVRVDGNILHVRPEAGACGYVGCATWPAPPTTAEELATLRVDLARVTEERDHLTAQIGRPPDGSHPDEWYPRDRTWHGERANWQAEVGRLRDAYSQLNGYVEQVLGKALGYPWFKDDLKNFPDATEANGVCTGDHTAESIADEAAGKIDALTAAQPTPTTEARDA